MKSILKLAVGGFKFGASITILTASIAFGYYVSVLAIDTIKSIYKKVKKRLRATII